MGNKIWVFGCSFTESFKDAFNSYNAYSDYKNFLGGEFPPHWTELLSDRMGMDVVNFGNGGNGNDEIYHSFIKNSHDTSEGDIVIIEWSCMDRIRYPEYGGDLSESPFISYLSSEGVSPRKFKNFLDIAQDFRKYKVYYDEILDRISHLIDYAKYKKIKLFFWTIDGRITNHMVDSNYEFYDHCLDSMICDKRYEDIVDNFNSNLKINPYRLPCIIYDETNESVNDSHFGKHGNLILSDLLYSFINNT